jgi:hypothetical protein
LLVDPKAGSSGLFSYWAAFIAASVLNCYIEAMKPRRTRHLQDVRAPFVLRDHDRLPGRFFGRMTASIQAGL